MPLNFIKTTSKSSFLLKKGIKVNLTAPLRIQPFKSVGERYYRTINKDIIQNLKMCDNQKRDLPKWIQPKNEDRPSLKVFNTLTKEKDQNLVPFVTSQGNQIKWYNCGPTVYDSAHMGHARLYVTIDVLRRVLSDYFGYNINFVMNITDIDDKIIIRARQNYLFDQFVTQLDQKIDSTSIIETLTIALDKFLQDKFETESLDEALVKAKLANADPKLMMHHTAAKSASDAIIQLKSLFKSNDKPEITKVKELVLLNKDVLAAYLDKQKGSGVTDQKIFRELAAYWEDDFMSDMKALNVLPADTLTRVSEYVPEVVSFVERIIGNGYGYEVDGSVYFDTAKFDHHPDHYYAKLEPNSANNLELIEDGEGSLGAKLTGKKNPSDFALWKKSKAGEPFWESPWGQGRPGWHIECSAMASEIFGSNMDIHSGGEDLAFPHHDNELAQSEAHHSCHQWVNYFFHVGHLHIEGQKMSKSLKNFITIKEALQKYSAKQLRLAFLMHQWDSGMDFKQSSMEETWATEKLFNNFLLNAKALVAEAKAHPLPFTAKHNFNQAEKALLSVLTDKQDSVHSALLDSFNTPLVIKELNELINKTNIYIATNRPNGLPINSDLIDKIAKYLNKMLTVFGLSGKGTDSSSGQSGEVNTEDIAMPYLRVLSSFRDQIRSLARNNADAKDLLTVCDALRDNDLVDLGVLLDDREDGRALVKLVDRGQLIKERAIKLEREEAKRAQKAAAVAANEQKRLEKLAKAKISPEEMFKTNPEFSKFDEQGIPTHDKDGAELAKSRRKKLVKEHDQQRKVHQEYLASN